MATGVLRTIDPLGRVTIPAEIRKQLSLTPSTELEVRVERGDIVLAPVKQRCPECGTPTSTSGQD